MQFSKLSSPTLKELFVSQLENMILSGELEIGRKLPPERELAKSMQISRAVVHTGIVEMSNKGFLEIRPRVGTFVADYRRTGTLETLISIMNFNGGTLRSEEIRSILEIRIVLERLALELTVPTITDQQVEILRGFADQLKDAKEPSEAANFAFKFHHELAVISRNCLLPLVFHSFKLPILNLWERFCRMHGIEALYHNTEGLYKEIENRNLEKAIKFLYESIEESIAGSRQIYI